MCLTAGRKASDRYKSFEFNQQPTKICEELNLNSPLVLLL